ncbi:hypothetical protein Tco_0856114, partial [Tanacetum coccineum]
ISLAVLVVTHFSGTEIQLDDKLHFIEEPVEIIDREVKQLKQSRIPIVKALDGMVVKEIKDGLLEEMEGVQVWTFMRRVLTDSRDDIGRGGDVLRRRRRSLNEIFSSFSSTYVSHPDEIRWMIFMMVEEELAFES